MRKKNKVVAILIGGLTLVQMMALPVMAAPSINQLQSKQDTEIVAGEESDGTNTSQILSDEGVYVDRADSEEYMKRDEEGNPVPTRMSETIDAAKKTDEETKENGKSIVERIPTVEEVFSVIDAEAGKHCEEEYGVELGQMKQLSYMLDLKYISTSTRVIAGEKVSTGDYAVILDNGTVKARICGGEILRQEDASSVYIMHVNEETEKITVLQMEDYDPETGTYTITFPGIGPYMLVQSIEAE